MSTSNPASLPKLSRRQSLQLGAATTAVGLLATQELVTPVQAKDPEPPKTTPFVVPLPVYPPKQAVGALTPTPTENAGPGEAGRAPHQRWAEFLPQKFYNLNVRQAQHSFHPELPTQTVWGFDGLVPGPTIAERYGVPNIVRIYNDLPANTVGFGSPEITTHLHNMHTASESDGFAGDYYSATRFGPTLTAPGAYLDHHYVNAYAGFSDPRYSATNGDPREALGTLWYHDHRVDFTAPNIFRGLAGMYLLFDDIDSGNELDTNPKALRLPSGVGKYDIPLVIDDKVFDSSGYLFFDQFATKGILGNKVCINGKVQPFFKVERRKYRFRLLDTGPSRFYEFYLTNGSNSGSGSGGSSGSGSGSGLNQSFTHIANDGNLLPAPLSTKKLELSPAERADLVIDFSSYPLGTKLYWVNRLVQIDGRGPEGPLVNTRGTDGLLTTAGTQLLRFDIDSDPPTPDLSRVPATLRALPPINLAEVVRTRKWRFDRENSVWTTNDQIFEVNKPAAFPKRGTTEIWVLQGSDDWHHPVHIHFEEGRILSRNGKPPPPHEAGRKDVYVVHPLEEVRVFIRFRDFLGKYLMHCHNLIHEDHAMMVRWDIVP
ncbi:multicopper oxidase domain-containing protein [Polaromonas sp. P2-4]|nr:multicopper oxidase domain-containing protein [Polaromonas sp. P2-4]